LITLKATGIEAPNVVIDVKRVSARFQLMQHKLLKNVAKPAARLQAADELIESYALKSLRQSKRSARLTLAGQVDR